MAIEVGPGNPAELSIFLNNLAGPLVERVTRRSVAAQMSTTITANAAGVTLPIIDSDATATWTDEGAEIVQSTPELRSLHIRTGKLAGIVPVTGEAIRSQRLDLLQIASRSLVRDMANKLDQAFFGNVAAPAPSGIGALTDVATIEAASGDNLDSLVDAIAHLQDLGHDATDVALNPSSLARMAKVKKATGSNESLLGADATLGGVLDADQPDGGNAGQSVLGLRIHVSRFVTDDTLVVVDRGQVYTGLTGDPVLDSSDQAEFTKDVVLIRALQAAGFGFPHTDAIVKIALPAAA